MAATAVSDEMADDNRRSILTDREREIIAGEADVDDKYYSVVVTRVRNKIEGVEEDLQVLDQHREDLADELREIVCEQSQNSED